MGVCGLCTGTSTEIPTIIDPRSTRRYNSANAMCVGGLVPVLGGGLAERMSGSIIVGIRLSVSVHNSTVLACIQEWVAAYRLAYGVAESHIGRRQIKQIDLAKAPAMHIRKFGQSIHERHNPEGMKQFKIKAMDRLKNGGKGVNASHLMPHELMKDVERGDEIAELQYLSLIQKTKTPSKFDIMPVADVSGSMSGIPMEVLYSFFMQAAKIFSSSATQIPTIIDPSAARKCPSNRGQ
jgi:hypothetical protein